MRFDIDFDGFEEVGQLFKKLPDQMQKRAYVGALRRGGAIIRRELVSILPQDTGNLKKSIKVKISKSQRVAIIGPSVGRRAKNDGFYLRYLDDGTKFIDANNYIMTVFEASNERAVFEAKKRLAKDVINEAIRLSQRIGAHKMRKFKV